MTEKRRDNRGRILHNGEVHLPTGQYRYKYTDENGKTRYVYSWRLDKNDPNPKGKRCKASLRELEKGIQADLFDHIRTDGGNYTVLELVKKYTAAKNGVRPTTQTGYQTVVNRLGKDPFGQKRIDLVRISDAKTWLVELQKKDHLSFSTIRCMRGVIRPAFQMAMDDDLIRKNPFAFELVDAVVNDSVRRNALTRDQQRKFLKFVREDKHYIRYYDGILILFQTGLRISEFCGLTVSDIDFKKHTINVERQLQKHGKGGYYIEKTKTENGTRVLPMTGEVEEAFRRIISARKPPKAEPMVDGVSGFLYFDKDGKIKYSLHWEHYFKRICQKYNSIYKVQMPQVTPHVCRHTYCSDMARSGMNPKTLQYLMGHSDISVTLNVYTHFGLDEAEEELRKMKVI